MKFNLPSSEIFVPDGLPTDQALSRTTHLGIGAHQDDLEIMAFHGILECFQREDKWFSGVIVTNGSGSPRDGRYTHYTDDDMRAIRRVEQKKAAVLGEYACQILLDYPSSDVKDGANEAPCLDIMEILKAARPQVVYTHNLADKHDTHIGVGLKVVEAIRGLNPGDRPQKLYGCEVWRDLDWMTDEQKVAFDVSENESLQSALLGVFDSQISGGKRYDLATMGRRRANATYHASHGVDVSTGIIFAMDLTPLASDRSLDVIEYLQGFMAGFVDDVSDRISRLQGI
jgi:LmbE family N-acetylglucosaminyl deacetylase